MLPRHIAQTQCPKAAAPARRVAGDLSRTLSPVADPSFTGQRQDTVAGRYDFPPASNSYQGRWSSPDPAGLDTVNPPTPNPGTATPAS